MQQTVVVTRLADRHEDAHSRRFAETYQAHVLAGGLRDVVGEALRAIPALPRGRYVIHVDWPFTPDTEEPT